MTAHETEEVSVPPDKLTPAEVNQICGELFMKAEAWFREAQETREYVGLDEEDEQKAALARIENFRARALGFVAHICELRQYWTIKNPEQKLLSMKEVMTVIAGRVTELEWTLRRDGSSFRYATRAEGEVSE
jgi:hypothetical protein